MMESNKSDRVREEQESLQELIRLKKQKQAAAEQPEDVVAESPQEEAIVPRTFREKWDNYWYHYKLVTWLAVFVVFVAGWFVKDIFFGMQYDLVLNIASKYTFSSINDQMDIDAAAYAADTDGNGKISVQINEMKTNYDGTGLNDQSTMVGEQEILAVLNAGADLVFILDQQTYDQLLQSNNGESIFADLSALYPDMPELVVEDRVLMQQTPLGLQWKMNVVDSPLYLCVRKLDGGLKDTEKNREKYEAALSFVDHVIKGEPTQS